MDIGAIMKLRSHVARFQENHPKFLKFIACSKSYVNVGSIIEIKIKDAEGREILSNIKVCEDDINLFHSLKSMGETMNGGKGFGG